MKKQSYAISLTNPCSEDWSNMTSNQQGRHCASCNKTVIDFSLYTDKQLIEFFKNSTQGVCGHIPKYQLDRVITVHQPSRFGFLRNAAWVTALASWFGFSNKADAQQKYTPHPVRMTDGTQPNDRVQTHADSIKNSVTFSFYDAKSGKPISYIYGTMQGTISFAGDSTCRCRVTVPDSLIGKKALFYFYSEDYEGKEMLIDLARLPMKKKIYLNFLAHKVMVNGGLGMRNIPNDKLNADVK
jgi:hypothetical protein